MKFPYYVDRGLRIWCKKVSVCHKRKIMYIPMPKAASKTMRWILEQVGFARENYKNNAEGYWAFTTLRNPLDRYVSAHMQATRGYIAGRNRVGNPCSNAELWGRFLDGIEKNMERIWDPHFFPAVWYLQDYNQQDIPIQHYIILENIEKGQLELEKLLRLELAKVHKNPSNEYRKNFYHENMKNNLEVIRLINEMYSEDWKLYNAKAET